jgi:hypothetical protein
VEPLDVRYQEPRPAETVDRDQSPIGGLPVPKGADMKDTQIHVQYSTGLSRRNIEQALVAAGKDLNHLQPADLELLEDFHTIWPLPTSCALSWSPPGSRSSTGTISATRRPRRCRCS